MAPGIWPRWLCMPSQAASAQAGIPMETCSVAARTATLGLGFSRLFETLMRKFMMAVFCLKSGAGMMAMSEQTSSLW